MTNILSLLTPYEKVMLVSSNYEEYIDKGMFSMEELTLSLAKDLLSTIEELNLAREPI